MCVSYPAVELVVKVKSSASFVFVRVMQSRDIVNLSVYILRTHVRVCNVAVVVSNAFGQEVDVFISTVLNLDKLLLVNTGELTGDTCKIFVSNIQDRRRV